MNRLKILKFFTFSYSFALTSIDMCQDADVTNVLLLQWVVSCGVVPADVGDMSEKLLDSAGNRSIAQHADAVQKDAVCH